MISHSNERNNPTNGIGIMRAAIPHTPKSTTGKKCNASCRTWNLSNQLFWNHGLHGGQPILLSETMTSVRKVRWTTHYTFCIVWALLRHAGFSPHKGVPFGWRRHFCRRRRLAPLWTPVAWTPLAGWEVPFLPPLPRGLPWLAALLCSLLCSRSVLLCSAAPLLSAL